MSRNSERIGGVQQRNADTPPAQMMQQESKSEGFSFVVPTEFVDLPSQGRYYPEGHPLHNESSIEIKQMTAKEEDILTSKTLLKKGVALDRVIQNVIVDKSIKADSLLVGDKNTIIVALRVSGYGADYATEVTCPACGTQQKYTFRLTENRLYSGEEKDDLDITDHNNGVFEVTLPSTQVRVAYRLQTGADEKTLLNMMENDRKRKTEMNVTRQLRNIIVGVNDDTSAEAINYLVDNMPAIDSRHLRLAYKLSAPNIDMSQAFECSECQYDQTMEVPLTADFFWPDR